MPESGSVTLPIADIRAWLDSEPATTPDATHAEIVAQRAAETWRERLWTCPADTRMGVREVAEALDRSADAVYRMASVKLAAERGRSPLPCSRLDGVLVFRAGDVRRWLDTSAVVVNPPSAPLKLVSNKRRTP